MARLGLFVACAVLSGCGGSSSETPFPQSASEVAAIPVLQRPMRATKRPPPGGRQPAPAAAPGEPPPRPVDPEE